MRPDGKNANRQRQPSPRVYQAPPGGANKPPERPRAKNVGRGFAISVTVMILNICACAGYIYIQIRHG